MTDKIIEVAGKLYGIKFIHRETNQELHPLQIKEIFEGAIQMAMETRNVNF